MIDTECERPEGHEWQLADGSCELGCEHRRLFCDHCALTVDVDQVWWQHLTAVWLALDLATRP